MKYFLTSVISLFLTLSASLSAENTDFEKTGVEYFQGMPTKEFCEIWSKWCDQAIESNSEPYYKGYWQGQKDICDFINNKNQVTIYTPENLI